MSTECIIDWASKLPVWQQDALRRLTSSSELTDADVAEVLANLKRENGLPQVNTTPLEPLTKDHLKSNSADAPLATICSIRNIKNANRLASNQKLSFAPNGITLIYGHNGSGKSGYCRILKKLCRAIVKDEIHPNVYDPNLPSHPAEAVVSYNLGGATKKKEFTWRDREAETNDIAHLSVFDSHNARLYVDERNKIDYLPYEIDLLTRFGRLLMQLQELLDTENSRIGRMLQVPVTGYTEGTSIYNLVNKLTSDATLEELPTIQGINAQGKWGDEQEQVLKTLQQEIASDPKVLAASLHRIGDVASSLIEELTIVRDALSQSRISDLRQAAADQRAASETASTAAKSLFEGLPLEHVGSDPWHKMFMYAKEYSTLVYPGIGPPATRENDLCVLCQQPLSPEAAERLQRFEQYVVGKAKLDAERAAAKLSEKVEAISTLSIRGADDVKQMLGEFASLDKANVKIVDAVVKFVETMRHRQAKLVNAVNSEDFPDINVLDNSAIEKLTKEIRKLQKKVTELNRETSNHTEREKRRKQLDELLDRKHLSKGLESVCARRDDLEKFLRLGKCRKAVNTNAVSRQVTALRKNLVSDQLKKRIRSEAKRLNLDHIPLRINDDSRQGASGYTVSLESQQRVSARDVLSEGEQRALGLACFLADVNGQSTKHGIIVDDPVSSLDHVRMNRVAKRMVDEAASGRQVIIFTHSLPFYFEVMSQASERDSGQIPVLANYVHQNAGKHEFGVVEKDSPWEAKSTGERIEALEMKIGSDEFKLKADACGDEYRDEVVGFYASLRETWERLVEADLLYKVVERYGSDVKTQRLNRVNVKDKDYKKIYHAMKRASKYSGHDTAPGQHSLLPTIKEMKQSVDELKKYYADLRARGKATERKRTALENPPVAERG